MSNAPLVSSDNLFDYVLHPTFVLSTVGDDVVNHEAFRVGDNLRDLTNWTPGTTNAIRFLLLDCLAAQPTNIIILDRNHNLGGVTIALHGSTDNFAASDVTIASWTIPTTAGGLSTGAAGCLTPLGVWWAQFSTATFRYYKLVIPAMGVNVAPSISSLYLGASYRCPQVFSAPNAYDYRTRVDFLKNELSRGGVRIKSRPLNFDEINIDLQLEGTDYAAFDAQIRPMLRKGHPWWVCLDDSDATLSGLMRLFQLGGNTTYDPVVNPVHREIRFTLEEVMPAYYV